jgi:N-acetylmuramoyl-L-alanine amidase
MPKPIKYLIIHCTATPEGREVSSDEIRRWHLSPKPQGRGWKQVGYTDLFHLNGGIERLVKNNEDAFVDGWEITNGVAGLNSHSRHIVYAGGLTADGKKAKDTRTLMQREVLKTYVLDFVKRFPGVQVAGHNQFDNKACPSFNVPLWLREIGVPSKNIRQ